MLLGTPSQSPSGAGRASHHVRRSPSSGGASSLPAVRGSPSSGGASSLPAVRGSLYLPNTGNAT